MSIIGWILLGLLAGVIAKRIMPASESIGIILTTLLGIVGALLGGFLAMALGLGDPIDEFFDISTWVAAIIGALIILFAWNPSRAAAPSERRGQQLPTAESPSRKRSGLSAERERAAGIEPAWLAWKARALPLSYARANVCHDSQRGRDPVGLRTARAVRRCRACRRLRDRRTRRGRAALAPRVLRRRTAARGRSLRDPARLARDDVAAERAPTAERRLRGVGARARRARRAGRPRRAARSSPPRAPLTHPAVALPLWLATYAAWHLPLGTTRRCAPVDLLHLEHATYFATGLLFWWPVLQDAPRRLSYGAKAAYIMAAFVLASPLGIVLSLLSSPAYDVLRGGAEHVGPVRSRRPADRRGDDVRRAGGRLLLRGGVLRPPPAPRGGGARDTSRTVLANCVNFLPEGLAPTAGNP